MTLSPISSADAQARVAAGTALLIDVREADEFRRRHIAGALSAPLSEQASLPAGVAGREVIFLCRSGARTRAACSQLAARVAGPAFMLDGGIDAWERSGLPVIRDAKAPMEIMRQVQIAAGLLILAGVVLGFAVAPGWFGLAAFVGAGLTFAGVTGFCGMARLLMLAPWNRQAAGQ